MGGLDYAKFVANVVRDAGGQLVGRTRLQKMIFIIEAAGLGAGFPFRYKHYGPYSEVLASYAQHAAALRLITEEERPTAWGGQFSIYRSPPAATPSDPVRAQLAREMIEADAVELELAATAAFLALEKWPDPWAETARRKPEKAENGRLDKARRLYQRLQTVKVPHPLPTI